MNPRPAYGGKCVQGRRTGMGDKIQLLSSSMLGREHSWQEAGFPLREAQRQQLCFLFADNRGSPRFIHPLLTYMLHAVLSLVERHRKSWKEGHLWNQEALKRKKDSFIFLDRGEGRERNINVWLPLTCPYWGPGPQPRHVPWLGIKPATLWFTVCHSIHWVTPAKASFFLFYFFFSPSTTFTQPSAPPLASCQLALYLWICLYFTY